MIIRSHRSGAHVSRFRSAHRTPSVAVPAGRVCSARPSRMITAWNRSLCRAASGIGMTVTRAVLSGGAYTAVRPDRDQWARPSIAAASSSCSVAEMI